MNQDQVNLSEWIVNAFFTACITIFAVWVMVIQIAQFIGISFLNLCIIYSIIIVPVLFLLAKIHFHNFKHSSLATRNKERNTIIILVCLALLGSAVSLGAIRPNADDVDYIARAVYFLKYYHETVDITVQPEYGLVQNVFSSEWNIFRTMEFFCAYLALILQLPFLHIYHLILPALGGAMIPLAWFLAFAKFTKRTIVAALAATAVCVFLSIDGATIQSFGNYAFVRIWQNKALLMSIATPLFIAFFLDFYATPIFSKWCRLFFLLVACTGLSPTGTFFMPFMGVLLGFSCWFSQGMKIRGSLKKLFMLFMSYSYLLLITFICYINLNKDRLEFLGSATKIPETFEGQFKMVFVALLNFPSITFAFCFFLSLYCAERYLRRFLIIWTALCIALLLNPIVFPFIAKNITTFNTYWRLFYLLPFPLVVGLSMCFLDRMKNLKPERVYTVFVSLLLVGLIGNLIPHKFATFGKVPFAFGRYKIYQLLEPSVKKIISVSKPGPMLAPTIFSYWIPTFSPDFPQVWIKRYALEGFSIKYGTQKEFQTKLKAYAYINGASQGINEIQDLMKQGLVNIVLRKRVTGEKGWPRFASILAGSGFECVEKNNYFLVYVRNE